MLRGDLPDPPREEAVPQGGTRIPIMALGMALLLGLVLDGVLLAGSGVASEAAGPLLGPAGGMCH